MKSPEQWQELFDEIVRNTHSVLASPRAMSTFYNPDIAVQISVDVFDISKNARATKISENEYEIILNVGLVAWLFETSQELVDDCSLIFFDIDRNQDNVERVAKVLFKLWVDFIIFHEWSHIICGHLEFSKTKSIWLEIPQDISSRLSVDNEQAICIEAEADAFASKFIAMQHAFSWKILSMQVYDSCRIRSITYDVVMAITLLFEAFDSLHFESNEMSHPSVSQRMSIFNWFFLAACRQYKTVDIDLDEFIVKSNLDYWLSRKLLSQEDINSLMMEMDVFGSKVGSTLATLNIGAHRLSSMAYHYK